MTSQNLELFPDDLFARKGGATPAGPARKDQAEVVALETAEAEPTRDDPEAPREGALAKGHDDDIPEGGETADEAGDETKDAKTEAKGRTAAEAAPAASVLKLRLLDEVSEDFDEILRGAEDRAPPPAETTESETPKGDPAPSTETPEEAEVGIGEPETEAGSAAAAAVRAEAPPPEQAVLWKPATWTTGTRTAAAVLLLALGLLAGWYAATPQLAPAPEGATASGGAQAEPPTAEASAPAADAGQDSPAPAQNALKALEGAGTPEPVEAEAPRVDVVRVEEDGSAIIAGMAAPGAELIVLHNGAPIGVAQADSFGQWVLLPEEPLAEGPHEFGLVVKAVEGSVTLPDPAATESDGPAAGASGGEAGDLPALDKESRLPAPEPGSKPAQALAEAPLPPKKPAADTAAALQDDTPSYVVQLASAQSAEGAASEWEKLRKAHPDLLGRQDLTVQEADLAGRGAVFRVRTGSFETLVAARRFCAAFRRQKQECLVVKQPEIDETPPQTRVSRNHS